MRWNDSTHQRVDLVHQRARMKFNEWLEALTGDGSAEIAKKTGIPKRTLQHQVAHDKPSLENLICISSTYGRSPISTLISLGFIDEVWAQVPDIEAALRLATDEQLTDEILRRLLAGSSAYDTPIDELVARREKSPNARQGET